MVFGNFPFESKKDEDLLRKIIDDELKFPPNIIIIFFRNVSDKVQIKEVKQKIEIDSNDEDDENKKNNSVKNPPSKSPQYNSNVKKNKSESSKGVVDLSYREKKQPREFNINASNKKWFTYSNNLISKKK
jgi:hypothetical protein